MELQADEQVIEFPHQDMAFLVKPHATDFDRFALTMTTSSLEYAEAIIRQMVTGWKNVTLAGKPATYSYALMKKAFPISAEKSVMLQLAEFILDKTDIRPKEDTVAKNA